MKKDVVVFLLLALLGLFCVALLPGCMTKEKAMKKYGITFKDSLRMRDTVITHNETKTVQKDSIVYHDSVPCNDFVLDLWDGKFTTHLESKAGMLTGKTVHDTSNVHFEASDTLKIPEHFHTTNVPPDHDCPYWVIDPACRVISLLTLILFVVWLILRSRK